MGAIDDYLKEAIPEFRQQLARLVTIPSSSQEAEHVGDLLRIVQETANIARDYGFTTHILQSEGNPSENFVAGLVATLEVDPNAPWIIVYNHLDVQPEGDGWLTKAFEPVVTHEKIIGRGATDDKGPMLTALHAVNYLRAAGKLKVNVALVHETKEEAGSTGFGKLIQESIGRQLLPAPHSILVCDTVFQGDNPTISSSLRGLLTAEVTVTTGTQAVHSGLGGGIAINPMNVLTQLLASCYNEATRKVTIADFYEGVLPIAGEMHENLRKVAEGFDLDRYKRDLRAGACYPQDRYEALLRNWHQPTFEIHNYKGGLEGTKIPPFATAQVTMRMVGQQDPDKVFAAVETHLRGQLAQCQLPLDVKLDVKKIKGSRAVSVAMDNPYVLAAAEACEAGFGRRPVYDGCGGTIGALPVFQEHFPQAPIVLLAISMVDDGYHAPNEEFKFSQAEKGIRVISDYLQRVAALPQVRP